MTTSYGKTADGTLEKCRAKAENRGKGRCPHAEHVDVPVGKEKEAAAMVADFNEQVLSQHLPTVPSTGKRQAVPRVSPLSVASHVGGRALSREELIAQSSRLASEFDTSQWEAVKKFSAYYAALSDKEKETLTLTDSRDERNAELARIEDKLAKSIDKDQQLREFLGKDVNSRELAGIMVRQVNSMTAAEKFKPHSCPVRRSLMSTLDNDMNKTRYFASVLFFGGRCCYCNRTLRKSPPPQHMATGEHLTCVNPEKTVGLPRIVGGTRFGNVALACQECNGKRGNQDLHQFVLENNAIANKDKPRVIARIEAFRKFAFYEDYTEAESKTIDREVQRIEKLVRVRRAKDQQAGSTRLSSHSVMLVRREIEMSLRRIRCQRLT